MMAVPNMLTLRAVLLLCLIPTKVGTIVLQLVSNASSLPSSWSASAACDSADGGHDLLETDRTFVVQLRRQSTSLTSPKNAESG
jgi:hypothetical protein